MNTHVERFDPIDFLEANRIAIIKFLVAVGLVIVGLTIYGEITHKPEVIRVTRMTSSDYVREYGGQQAVYTDILSNNSCSELRMERFGRPLDDSHDGYRAAAEQRWNSLNCDNRP